MGEGSYKYIKNILETGILEGMDERVVEAQDRSVEPEENWHGRDGKRIKRNE